MVVMAFLAAVAEDEPSGLEVDVLRVVSDEPLGVAVLHAKVHGHVAHGAEATEAAGGGGDGRGHRTEGRPGRLGGGPGGGPGSGRPGSGSGSGPDGGPRGGPLLLHGPLPDHHPPGLLGLLAGSEVGELSAAGLDPRGSGGGGEGGGSGGGGLLVVVVWVAIQ